MEILHTGTPVKKTLVVIVGPTAVGKSALAIHLAKQLGTEIISADSRQIFKEMTIGTAKPTPQEMAGVPHHFINSHSIDQEYNAAQFGDDALVVINRLLEHHRYVIMCGGSGLYVKAVCEGFDEIPAIPAEIRTALNQQYEENGLTWLQEELQRLDPEGYETLDQKNPHRLIRALEVRLATGLSIRTFQEKKKRTHAFTIVKIGLDMERSELYRRIDERMDEMIAAGLFEEAQSLYPFRHRNALQTVGYQEIFDFLEGRYDREEAVRLLKRNSRRYAKRQLTWFRRDETIQWFHPAQTKEIYDYIARL